MSALGGHAPTRSPGSAGVVDAGVKRPVVTCAAAGAAPKRPVVAGAAPKRPAAAGAAAGAAPKRPAAAVVTAGAAPKSPPDVWKTRLRLRLISERFAVLEIEVEVNKRKVRRVGDVCEHVAGFTGNMNRLILSFLPAGAGGTAAGPPNNPPPAPGAGAAGGARPPTKAAAALVPAKFSGAGGPFFFVSLF